MTKGKRDLLLLFVVIALGLLLASKFLGDEGEDPRHDFAETVKDCVENQRAVYSALVRHAREQGSFPAAAPGDVIDMLISSGILGDTIEQRALFTCPGSGDDPNLFVLRDIEAHPLESFPSGGGIPILTCPQSGHEGHKGILNVLFADGSVRTLSLELLKEQGHIPVDTTDITPGPNSTVSLLRVFPLKSE
ncbi:MAG: prepilin-type processing-associated H-X9-DG protein [Gammaproteobacteria bacterium]|jgi:prepilin-type processing-associated H-X9-DG protein